VDWWLMFKLGSTVPKLGGYTTAYTDANAAGSFVYGNMNDTNALSYTVKQIGLYGGKASSTTGWAMWNDQTHSDLEGPCTNHDKDVNGSVFGHSKGTMGFDGQTGFWLTHSAPGFPYDHTLCPTKWFFPRPQTFYAQHFFCVSIVASDVERFSEYLMFYHAFVYDYRLPPGRSLPSFKSFVNQNFVESKGTISFKSLGGVLFSGAGKYASTNSDLYEDYVAPLLKTNLLIQTWCGGIYTKKCQPSYCKGSAVQSPSSPQLNTSTYNYDAVNVENVAFGTLTYNNSYNHAKWAISSSFSSGKRKPVATKPWFCAGDINRQYSQRNRGGGAICFQNQKLFATLQKVVTGINATCPE